MYNILPATSAFRRFKNMSDQEWDQIMAVHLKGSYSCAKAAWPIFQKQGFGRIVNTASAAGLYGLYGLATKGGCQVLTYSHR